MDAPFFTTDPLPERTPEYVTASDRLNSSVPLLTVTLLVATLPVMLPVVPPLPIWSVPPVMVVGTPIAPVMVRVLLLLPLLINDPAPDIRPANVLVSLFGMLLV